MPPAPDLNFIRQCVVKGAIFWLHIIRTPMGPDLREDICPTKIWKFPTGPIIGDTAPDIGSARGVSGRVDNSKSKHGRGADASVRCNSPPPLIRRSLPRLHLRPSMENSGLYSAQEQVAWSVAAQILNNLFLRPPICGAPRPRYSQQSWACAPRPSAAQREPESVWSSCRQKRGDSVDRDRIA